jgi:hypothetical protein
MFSVAKTLTTWKIVQTLNILISYYCHNFLLHRLPNHVIGYDTCMTKYYHMYRYGREGWTRSRDQEQQKLGFIHLLFYVHPFHFLATLDWTMIQLFIIHS